MSKISVIIPVYNVEKYLSKCLDSVINQTYKDLEIICVNDCSPDNSLSILKEYAQNDNRIKIVNLKNNGGLSVARNSGLDVATGEYVYFLDSDDWIADNFLEKMYEAIIQQNQKAVCCTNVLYAYGDGTTKPLMKRNFNEKFVPYSHSCQMAWSWLLETSFLKKFNIIFPDGLKYEDLYFFNVVIRSLREVYVINSTIYYHFENKNSIMGSAQNRKINNFDIIEIIRLIYENYKKNGKLETWSIPFFYMPKYMLNIHENKPEFYTKLKELFVIMREDIEQNKNLYSEIEINFFNKIINSKNYEDFKKDNVSIIATLRQNIKNNTGVTN